MKKICILVCLAGIPVSMFPNLSGPGLCLFMLGLLGFVACRILAND